MLTQLEWLMLHLEPHEALELRAACDSFNARGVEMLGHCPICWLVEPVKDSPLITTKLVEGFVWAETPQGKEYWTAVHDKYKAIETRRSQANDN